MQMLVLREPEVSRGDYVQVLSKGLLEAGWNVPPCAFTLGRGEHHHKYHLLADQRL